jgi:CO/xanthine dehydrogenase Mo-binding subunit
MKNQRTCDVIGKSHPRVDVEEKTAGEYEFVGDISLPGMLHAKVLRSPHAHALVKNIDTGRAEALPGVVVVLTPDDVPDKLVHRMNGISPSEPIALDAHILERKARYVGDRVAAVAATTPEIAEEALRLIEVEYEVLPAVFDIEEAMKPDSPQVHDVTWFGGQEIPVKNNMTQLAQPFMSAGDVEEGLEQADAVVESEFKTSYPHNSPLGRPACICRPLLGGKLEVWNHTQSIHAARINLANTLGVPLSNIKVNKRSFGGAFGLYIGLRLSDPICASLALKTGRPVKLEETREEMFLDGGRHPAVLKLKMGATKEGTLTAIDMWVVDGIGAYGPIPDICFLMSGFLMSKYRCMNKRFDGRTVYTNTPPLCAMRGAGDPQIHFAVESQMDILAEKLGIDPVELRSKNNLREGDEFIGQGPAVRCTIKSCGLEEITKEGANRIGWENRKSTVPYKDRPWIKRGIGMAGGFHTSGCGSSEPNTYLLDYSGAIVKMNEDGTACLTLAAADFGSGNVTSIAAIVAEELGIHYDDIILTEADTENSLYEHWVHASRSVYSIGSAAKAASHNAKQVILEWASMVLDVPSDQIETKDRRVFYRKDPSIETSVRDVLEYAQSQFLGTAIGTASYRAIACPPHFVSTFAEVDVNTKTGEVKVVRVFHGADVGTPINPGIVRGQLIGGLHMGLGYALSENVVYDPDNGRVLNPNFRDYKLLTPLDMPQVETFLADTYEPTGPFGAKGVGEGSTNTVAPAVYNAVYNAIGVRIFTMPLTPEKILKALQERVKEVNPR